MSNTPESSDTSLNFPPHVDLDALISKAKILRLTEEGREKAKETKPTTQPAREISRRGFLKGTLGITASVALGGALGRLSIPAAEKPVPVQSQQAAATEPAKPAPKAVPVEAEPVKEKQPKLFPLLGIRNDILYMMPFVVEFGAKNVRIDGGFSTAAANGQLKDPSDRELFDEAKRLGLSVLWVFNPQQLISREEIRARLKAILSRDQDITIELGNEPDDTGVPYWKDRNLETFAEFVKISLEETARIKPDAKLVVGALVKQENIKELIAHLKKKGFDDEKIKNLTFAMHAYHSAEEIWSRIGLIKQATKGAPVMVTEIGITNGGGTKNVQNFLELYSAARSVSDGLPVFIHELPEGPDSVTGERFGLVSKETGRQTPDFLIIKNAVTKMEIERLATATPKTP